MNDFPVVWDLVMRTGLWDSQGANIASRYKDIYGLELGIHVGGLANFLKAFKL